MREVGPKVLVRQILWLTVNIFVKIECICVQEKEKREEERLKEEKRRENLKKLAEAQREAARRAKSAERRDAARIVNSGPPVKVGQVDCCVDISLWTHTRGISK